MYNENLTSNNQILDITTEVTAMPSLRDATRTAGVAIAYGGRSHRLRRGFSPRGSANAHRTSESCKSGKYSQQNQPGA